MNLASSVLGIVLVPVAGLAWEFAAGIALYKLFNMGTFSLATWVATFVLAALVNSGVEAIVLRAAFRIPFSRRVFRVLVLANCASVAVAYGGMWWHPPEY